MDSTKKLEILLTARDNASKKLNSLSGVAGRLGATIKKAGKVAAIGLAAAGATAVAIGFKAVNAFNAQERALTQLKTLMLNVKGAVLEDVKALELQASALQKVGVVGDEVTMMGQSQLATFQELQRKTIEKLTPSLLDMAVQINGVNVGQDQMQQLSNLVGKAMQGQVGALTRYGVSLSKAQEEQIKTGDEMERASTIAQVLEENFGGVNQAMKKTFAGSMQSAKNTIGDFMELVGKMIVQYIQPLVQNFIDWSDSVGGAEGMLQLLKDRIASTKKSMSPFIESLKSIVSTAKDMAIQIGEFLLPKLQALWNTVKDDLIPVLQTLWENYLKHIVEILGVALVVAIGLGIDAINLLIGAFTGIINFMENHKWIVLPLIGYFGLLWGVMKAQAGFKALTAGFDAISTKVIPRAIKKFAAFKLMVSSPIAMPALAIGLALASINQVRRAIVEVIQLKDTMNRAKQGSISSGVAEEQFLKSLKTARDEKRISKDEYNRRFKEYMSQRAHGGVVTAGTPYTVGERGQETFVPNESGRIIKSMDTERAGSQMTVTIGNITITTPEASDRFFKQLNRSDKFTSMGLTGASQ